MALPQTLFFYCNAISDVVRAERGIVTDSPAATRKVIGLCRALRVVGVRAAMVSMARGGGTRSGRFFKARVGRLGDIPVIYGPMWDVPIISQILSAIWLAACAFQMERRIRRSTHLFYNQMSAYLPAMAVLRLRDARVSVDIEDGPIIGRRPIYSRRLSTVHPSIFARLVSNGALLATTKLENGTPIRPTMAYFGAVPLREMAVEKSFTHGQLVALFAGYLNEDTGLTILAATIKSMRQMNDPMFDELVIEISGPSPGLAALQDLQDGSGPQVRVHGRLDDTDYRALLTRAHIGLSLKPVGGDVAETTFPSKTVEYAENCLALIATDIGDVRKLFGDSALYIERNEPDELIAHLRRALLDRRKIAELAERGRRLVSESLSYPAAGQRLARFLFPDRPV